MACKLRGYSFLAREKLVLSLILAGFINSTNNMISSASIIINKYPLIGNVCTLNGFVGQWSVQAGDFSTVSIALVTFYILMSGSNAQNAVHLVNKYIYLIIGLIWGVSFSTALVGYFFAGYAWTGTWCWFPEQALYPRYFLTHGPRILIFLIIIVTYTSLFIKLKREVTSKGSEKREIKSFESTHETSSQVNKTVNKMLIFPAIYVLLWSGGMVNRLLDATTGATDISRFLQGFTQFIPFADSILYAAVIGLKKIKIGDSTTNEFKSSQA